MSFSTPAQPARRGTVVERPIGGHGRIVTIGSAPGNDVVLDYPIVSGHHARLVIEGDEARIEDLGSTNGTSVNEPGRPIKSHPLTPLDAVFFGSLRVPAERLLEGRLALGRDPHQTLQLGPEVLLAGRDPASGLVLDDPGVSWHHARLVRSGAAVMLEDLDSTNGTFVNGHRALGRVSVAVGDLVALGSTTLRLRSLDQLEVRDVRGNLKIEVRDLVIDVPGKRLLEGTSLTLYPGELVGLMGPSGAGKTTLMLAMNGYIAPAAGRVLYNGQDLYSHYDQFRLHLGYVPQDDIMHGDLTVREALFASARLRLPSDMKAGEIDARIAKVLKQLDLEGTENVLIGSPTKKGISGGQRKRVNLAMELLTDPSVLFLDEPTSGLSSQDALRVMKVLRQLANDGKTILLTIHQPSREVFRLMDNLVLLARDAGSEVPAGVAFFGPAYPDSIHFLSPGERSRPDPSPDSLLEGLALKPAPEQIAAYRASPYQHRYVDQRAERGGSAGDITEPLPHRPATGLLLQWRALTMRSLRIKARDLANTAILVLQAPVIALLIVLVFGSEVSAEMTPEKWHEGAGAAATTIFLLAIAALWFGCSNAAREIVAEWSVYHRERMINLALPAYVGSKLAVLGVVCLVQCSALAFIVHRGCGLRAPWRPLLAVLVITSLLGMALGLLLSARAPSSEVAISLVPLALLPMVILGGILQPPHKMPLPGEVLSSVMPSRWAFEAMLLMESAERPESPDLGPPNGAARGGQELAEHYFPKDSRSDTPMPVVVLIAMLGISIALTLRVLRARDVHR